MLSVIRVKQSSDRNYRSTYRQIPSTSRKLGKCYRLNNVRVVVPIRDSRAPNAILNIRLACVIAMVGGIKVAYIVTFLVEAQPGIKALNVVHHGPSGELQRRKVIPSSR